MQTLEAIRRSIATAEELQSVVKAMKGMAAAGVRQFEGAVASLAEYGRTVEYGLQVLLMSRPERLLRVEPREAARLGVVLFGSDQGMCGRFNQQIVEHAVRAIGGYGLGPEGQPILIVGSRVLPLLEMAGLPVEAQVAPATSLAGIAPLVQEILARVEAWRSANGVDRIVLLYNEALGGAAYRPHTQQLYPVDLEWLRGLGARDWPSGQLPMYTLEWGGLFASLVREYFYVALYRAAAESLASENASRLASMQAAERNIEDRLDNLNLHFRHSRQQSITEELLDIVSGFEALSGGRG